MKRKLKVKFYWCWFDLWIGAYVDRTQEVLYICPLPTVVFAFWWWREIKFK